MATPLYRSAYATARLSSLVLGAVLAGGLGEREARAQGAAEPEALASMQCDRASEPGRVRCTVEVRVEGGRTIAWADVAILALPDFASPLKGRIGPEDALVREPASTKWAFGLVARRAGQGEAKARVRVVVCQAPRGDSTPPRCAPSTVDVKTQVTVGG